MNNEILNKEEICYFLLSSYNDPNILFCCKGIIKEIKFDYDEPIYLVKLEKIYDTIDFVKKHFYNMYFYNKFDQKHKIKINIPNKDTMIDVNSYLENKNINVIVHSLMTYSTKEEMDIAFNKINFYIIMLNLYNLRSSLLRIPYTGFLKIKNMKEFDNRLFNFVGDKFNTGQDIEIDFKRFAFEIERTRPLNAIKYGKVNQKSYDRLDKRKKAT